MDVLIKEFTSCFQFLVNYTKDLRVTIMRSLNMCIWTTHKNRAPRRGAASVVTEFYFLRLFSVNSCPKITHCFGRILSKLIPSCIKRKLIDISSVFRVKNLQDAGIYNVFLDKSCRNMYTCFAVLRQQRKSAVMTSLGLSARSAVYYITRSHSMSR
jgi:hypothetical protein